MSEELILLDVEQEIRKRQREKDKIKFNEELEKKENWEALLNKGRVSLWEFCRLKSPAYFTEDKLYLAELVNALQKFYEGKLLKEDKSPYKKLMLNLPPRHGKSRSLINLCQWILGKNNNERIIECSYNDKAAGDFAKYTRDGIQEERYDETHLVFADFFPKTKIKYGSHSYYHWALEGQFFNYLGAGIGGSITGKGGSVLIIDDPIKLAEEAFNEDRLNKIWDWYTGTFLSRGDAEGGEPLEIITMTRWSNNDLCGKILSSPEESKEWYVFKLEVYDKKTDQMLSEKVLSKKRYFELKRKMINEIFLANYHQETVDQKGRLYKSIKTYEKVPKDNKGNILFEQIRNYTDTADEGNDYLCSINYGVYQEEAYILDVLYTKDGMEITEPETAKFLIDSKVDVSNIESNNGGSGFARSVRRILWDKYKSKRPVIYWFHQSENKRARILSQSAYVQNHIYFPINWKDKFPEFHHSLSTFLKEGKNQHDDAEDAITGVAENCKARKIKSGKNIFNN